MDMWISNRYVAKGVRCVPPENRINNRQKIYIVFILIHLDAVESIKRI